MIVDADADRLISKKHFIYVGILLIVALGIGIYLIATTVLIAKDGVFYIEQAQNFSSKPINVIKSEPPFGYPFLIFIAHKFVTLFSGSSSVQTYIYSAQSVTLLCRLLAIIPLYFMGKLLVGGKNSFWAILILIMLPYPARFGSDALRDWPHILFLATGFLFLLRGAKQGEWWMFAAAGLAAGLGYTIRAECAQIVIYGILWLLISLFLPKPNTSRPKAVYLTLILLIGFAIPAAPYMKVRGKVLPPKLKRVISCNTPWQSNGLEQSSFGGTVAAYTASGIPIDILKAFGKLAQQTSENLMHFFVLPLVVGFYCHFRRLRKILLTERFFIFALIVLYLVMMVLLHINHGYISKRHFLPLVTFTIFYVPVGLQISGDWLASRFFKDRAGANQNPRLWFFILLAIGMSICLPKSLRPIRIEKQGYREAAKWLRGNTAPEDIVAVPDKRISFYAERKGLVYGNKFPQQAKYIVRIVKDEDEKPKFGIAVQEKKTVRVDKREKKKRIVIYEVL